MLGIEFAVWLAVLLSVASAALCAVYGLARWNVDDESGSNVDEPPSDRARAGVRVREADPS